MDQAAHHAEQLKLQHDIHDALKAAEAHGVPAEQVSLLAWATGVQYQPKGETHAKH